MKNFKMNFCHPIKGALRLVNKDAKCATHVIAVDTGQSDRLNISLKNIEKGDWNLVLNWEYEEKQYSYSRIISIT